MTIKDYMEGNLLTIGGAALGVAAGKIGHNFPIYSNTFQMQHILNWCNFLENDLAQLRVSTEKSQKPAGLYTQASRRM